MPVRRRRCLRRPRGARAGLDPRRLPARRLPAPPGPSRRQRRLGRHSPPPSTTPLPHELDRELATPLAARWLTDASARLTCAYDTSRRHALPDAVALPRTRDQVVALVRACRRHRVPVVARGRATNTTGAAVPVEGGVVVSMERMDRVLDIRPGD